MLEDAITFYDKDALLYRLHEGLEGSNKEVVFVIGAPATAPSGGRRGVANVAAVVELVRAEFLSKPAQLEKLDATLLRSPNPYQAAFDFLVGRAGQDAANKIIRKAVARALTPLGQSDWNDVICKMNDEQLRALDQNPQAWELSSAIESLGILIAKYPERLAVSLVVV
ncbi:hypothetical protein [Jiella pelagia]|uniref:Uncharacterized protein n=1 Tax=Jiella pelagia TaxID=2986949 RepID=A0ABY7C537_9HYPH|nr:hypothetical protein [Jiella pelagia]WAP69898.1 hypothetical protein OH818_06855 [Jiella pelagia]